MGRLLVEEYGASGLPFRQDIPDDMPRKARERDRLVLITGKHFGGIAGVADVDSKRSKPLHVVKSRRSIGIRPSDACQQTIKLMCLGKLNLIKGSAASRSASAFAIHSFSSDARSGSSGFIEYAPVLICRVRHTADEALGALEAFGPDDQDIHRVPNVTQRAADRHSPFVGVGQLRLDHEQINVAIGGHLPRCSGSKQNDPVRFRDREDTPDYFVE